MAQGRFKLVFMALYEAVESSIISSHNENELGVPRHSLLSDCGEVQFGRGGVLNRTNSVNFS